MGAKPIALTIYQAVAQVSSAPRWGRGGRGSETRQPDHFVIHYVNTTDIVDRSEVMVLAALLKAGKAVLQPFGDNQRYDLVLEESGQFKRIQVKTGRFKGGVIEAPTASTYAHRGGKRRGYHGQADLFAIYCPELDKVYMVPVEAAGNATVTLRVSKPKKSNGRPSKLAADYEFIGHLPDLNPITDSEGKGEQAVGSQ